MRSAVVPVSVDVGFVGPVPAQPRCRRRRCNGIGARRDDGAKRNAANDGAEIGPPDPWPHREARPAEPGATWTDDAPWTDHAARSHDAPWTDDAPRTAHTRAAH